MENLRIRVRPDLNKKFGDFCERKRISKQDTIEGLLTWFLADDQDGLLQSIIVGQVEKGDHPDLLKIIVERFAKDRHKDKSIRVEGIRRPSR